MGRLIVISFLTLDGVAEDPDGSGRTPAGGWAMRHGPAAIAGDKFRLGPLLEQGTLLFGRRTWELFSTLWPSRDDPFSRAMNAADKAVVTHREVDPAMWSGSHAVDRPLTAWVRDRLPETDLVVVGSLSVVEVLAGEDLVDEYRLLTFPTAVGAGRRLFTRHQLLEVVSTEPAGPAVLTMLTTRQVLRGDGTPGHVDEYRLRARSVPITPDAGGTMGKVIASITTSVDGFVTGPDDGPGRGLGRGGERLHHWVMGGPWTYEGEHELAMSGPDKDFYDELVADVRSGIVGRGMYDASGAWGGTNPFPGTLFVLTHRIGDQPPDDRGFRFVDGLDAALAGAIEAAAGGDVAVGGGADVIRQALAAGRVDELAISTAPVVLGAGKRLFDGFHHDLDLEVASVHGSAYATHVRYRVLR